MIRAAIYSRFSSDLQSDRSIEDQQVLCRGIAARQGFEVVACFEDRALSGTSTAKRGGFSAMMQAASAGLFQVVIAEDIDRISRDQADWHLARKRLEFMGVKIHTPSGVVGSLDGSVRAMMAEHFIENLAAHTRRGLAGVIRDGRSAGGLAYGYRAIPGRKGELEIVEDQAAVIRRIFSDYVAGATPKSIAVALNSERIKPPRGNFWRGSSLLGNPHRGNGILLNELYAGRLVWNRVRMIRDPETGKRVSRVNPEADWHRSDAAHLRIIDEETFKAAQNRREARGFTKQRGQRPPRYMLSGLLRCGECGAGMSVKDRDNGRVRIICTQHREAGACTNGRSYYLDKIETCVIDILRSKIGSRDAVAHFIRCYNEEQRASAADVVNRRSRAERALAEAQRGIDRMIDAIASDTITKGEAADRMPALREARDAAKAELDAIELPPKVISLHPAAIKEYLNDLGRLEELISEDLKASDDGLAKALRRLVQSVTVMPAPRGQQPTIRVTGHLESLIDPSGTLHPPFVSGGKVQNPLSLPKNA